MFVSSIHKVNQIDEVKLSVSAIDFENHKLARQTTYNKQTARDSLVDLHDFCDVILASLKTEASCFYMLLEGRKINARQILMDHSFAAVHGLPHCHESVRVPSNHKVFNLTHAIDSMVFVYIGNVGVIKCEFNLAQEVC